MPSILSSAESEPIIGFSCVDCGRDCKDAGKILEACNLYFSKEEGMSNE